MMLRFKNYNLLLSLCFPAVFYCILRFEYSNLLLFRCILLPLQHRKHINQCSSFVIMFICPSDHLRFPQRNITAKKITSNFLQFPFDLHSFFSTFCLQCENSLHVIKFKIHGIFNSRLVQVWFGGHVLKPETTKQNQRNETTETEIKAFFFNFCIYLLCILLVSVVSLIFARFRGFVSSFRVLVHAGLERYSFPD